MPIISVVGSLMRDIIFETERIPKLGESVAGTGLSFQPAGKGANIAVAAYRACHLRPSSGSSIAPNPSSAHPSLSTSPTPRDITIGTTAAPSDPEIQVFMNGAVGSDDVGPWLRSGLEAQGIDVSGVSILPGEQTGHAAIILQTNAGQASQLGFKGANLLFRPAREDDIGCLAGGAAGNGSRGVRPDVLITHCTMDLGTVLQVLEIGRRAGVTTMLSASPPVSSLASEVYQAVEHLVFNEHEAAEMAGCDVNSLADVRVGMEVAMKFVERGCKHVVITLGEHGAVYATHDNRTGHVPAEKGLHVRDTTGAGDSFLGAYAVQYIRQKATDHFDIEKAVAYANKAAAYTVQHIGAQASLPWFDQIGKS